MSNRLFRKQFALKSKILIAFISTFTFIQAQNTAFLRLNFPEYGGQKIQIVHSPGMFSKGIQLSVDLDSNGFHLLNLNGTDLAIYAEVFSPDLSFSKEIYVPINDTLVVHFDKKNSEFTLIKDVYNRNARIAETNTLIDKELTRFYKSRRSFTDKKRLLNIADSARLTVIKSTDAYFKTWEICMFSDLDLASGLLNQEQLIKRSFTGIEPAPQNPAWQRAFSAIFENDLLVRLQGGNGTRYKLAFQQQQLDSLQHLFQSDTLISGSSLVEWLVVFDLYRASHIREIRLEDAYQMLLQFKENPNANAFLKSEVERMLKFLGPRIKGSTFPDIPFWCLNSDAELRLSALQGKPMYVALLPDNSPNAQLVLKQLLAFHSKYGKEMRFLAIVNEVLKKDQAAFLKNAPEIYLGTMESCRIQLEEIFPELNRIQFILLDRNGHVYQNPAEGPETGVEDAFLNLLKTP